MRNKIKAARLSVLSNTGLVILKVTAGLAMGSISVLSEAIHSGVDLIAALIAYYSVRESSKPADEVHRYGHGKFENVSGAIEALLISLAAVIIMYQAILKILRGGEVARLDLGISVMAFSAVVNYAVSGYLFRVAEQTDSIALHADAWHLRTDVWTSAGVLAGLALIHVTGLAIIDPIVAILISLLILRASYNLTKDAFSNILDVKLPYEDEARIKEILGRHSSEFREFHKLRTRKSGGDRYIDLHLVVEKGKNIEQVHDLSNIIEAEIKAVLPNVSVLIHLEPCSQHCNQCDPECPHLARTGL